MFVIHVAYVLGEKHQSGPVLVIVLTYMYMYMFMYMYSYTSIIAAVIKAVEILGLKLLAGCTCAPEHT